jgi:transcriptional regulator with XRE-family HTH domain
MSMRIEEVIGGNIRARREATGMTQEDLGRRVAAYLDREWPRQSISTAEKGGRSFTASELVAFALALSIPVRELFRVPADELAVTLSSGVSIDAGLLETIGAAESPSKALNDLRTTLRHLEAAQHSRRQEAESDIRAVWAARMLLDGLAEEWGQPTNDATDPS